VPARGLPLSTLAMSCALDFGNVWEKSGEQLQQYHGSPTTTGGGDPLLHTHSAIVSNCLGAAQSCTRSRAKMVGNRTWTFHVARVQVSMSIANVTWRAHYGQKGNLRASISSPALYLSSVRTKMLYSKYAIRCHVYIMYCSMHVWNSYP
jgi:hypothetical protein